MLVPSGSNTYDTNLTSSLPVKLRVLICIQMVHELVVLCYLLDVEHEERWKAQYRGDNEREKNGCGVVVLRAKP